MALVSSRTSTHCFAFLHFGLTVDTAIDTSQSLFAEFIFQICTDDKNYHEFLDLPVVLWIRHPFCFSIGHKQHGKSMQTGWPASPSSLSERIEADTNVLFETWTSNVAKYNMDEVSCNVLRADLKSVKLTRPELYTRAVTGLIRRTATAGFDDLTFADLAQETMYQSVEVMDDGENDG
jgi:hypothetical protein